MHITKKHFSGLKLRNRELEEENRALQQRLEAHLNAVSRVPVGGSPCPTPPLNHPSVPSVPSAVSSLKPPDVAQDEADEDDGSSTMVNPLSCGPPKYITDTAGRPRKMENALWTVDEVNVGRLSWTHLELVSHSTSPPSHPPSLIQVSIPQCGAPRRHNDIQPAMERPSKPSDPRHPRSPLTRPCSVSSQRHQIPHRSDLPPIRRAALLGPDPPVLQRPMQPQPHGQSVVHTFPRNHGAGQGIYWGKESRDKSAWGGVLHARVHDAP